MRAPLLIAASLLLAVALPGCAVRSAPAIVSRAAWDPSPPPAYRSPLQQPRRIIIHHDSVDYRPEQSGEEKARSLLYGSRQRQGWEDVPYHYLIDRDGRIFAGRPEYYQGDTHARYDAADALQIALLGNYSRLEPTEVQISALLALVRFKAKQYRLSASDIKLHDEVARTECPGTHLEHRLKGIGWLAPSL